MPPWSNYGLYLSPHPLSLSEVGASDFVLVNSLILCEVVGIQTFQEPSKSHNIVWALASYGAAPCHPTSCVTSLYKVTLNKITTSLSKDLYSDQSQQRSTLISLSKDLL